MKRTRWSLLLPVRNGAIVMLSVAAAACGTELPQPTAAHAVRSECPATSSDDFYFPTGALAAARDEDRTYRVGVSRYLSSTGSRSLSCGNDETEAYRMLWLPAFRPALVASATRNADEWTIEAAEFRHPQTRQQWTIEKRFNSTATSAEARPLLDALDAVRFWTIPAWKKSTALDGATWVIEGRRGSGYRAVSRHTPEDDLFKNVARALVRLAGMKVPEQMEE